MNPRFRIALAFALLCSLVSPARSDDRLGRLFFTPEQRATLDARRRARLPDKPAAAAPSPVTRLDGYVKRSQGPSTVWMNGESLSEGSPEAPRIESPARSDGGVSITIGENGRRVRLKAGESLDRGNGEVKDVIGDGEIEVNRSPARPQP
jgi:hypothetical protein